MLGMCRYCLKIRHGHFLKLINSQPNIMLILIISGTCRKKTDICLPEIWRQKAHTRNSFNGVWGQENLTFTSEIRRQIHLQQTHRLHEPCADWYLQNTAECNFRCRILYLDQCWATFLHSQHTRFCRRVMAAHQPHFEYCGGGGEMDVLLSNSI
jgi:hypothetical protein